MTHPTINPLSLILISYNVGMTHRQHKRWHNFEANCLNPEWEIFKFLFFFDICLGGDVTFRYLSQKNMILELLPLFDSGFSFIVLKLLKLRQLFWYRRLLIRRQLLKVYWKKSPYRKQIKTKKLGSNGILGQQHFSWICLVTLILNPP